MNEMTKIALFQKKEIRKIIHEGEWWFSIVDVCAVLTESENARRYWSDLKIKLKEEGSESYEEIVQLKLEASDGKKYETDCASTEGILRIIQSIPSPKAEPFKRWLAKVGFERIKEIENPELATQRTRMLYKAKGYSDAWIEKRMRGITIREEPTDEWKDRGAENKDFGVLTSEISKATFGLTPKEFNEHKGLEKENLRDHMDDFELIFTMLGERSTTEIHRTENSQGKRKLVEDAGAGGEIAGRARKALEKKLKKSLVSKENYLEESEGDKRKRLKSGK